MKTSVKEIITFHSSDLKTVSSLLWHFDTSNRLERIGARFALYLFNNRSFFLLRWDYKSESTVDARRNERKETFYSVVDISLRWNMWTFYCLRDHRYEGRLSDLLPFSSRKGPAKNAFWDTTVAPLRMESGL